MLFFEEMFTMIVVISRVLIYIIVLVSTVYLVGGHKMLLPLHMLLVSVRLV